VNPENLLISPNPEQHPTADKPVYVRVAVIGGGSWATAIVKILSENAKVKLRWWLRNPDDVRYVKTYGHNPKYLSDIQVNLRKVKPQKKLRKAIHDADFVVFAVPAAFLLEVLEQLEPEQLVGKTVVSAIKGMIPNENILITEYLTKHLQVPADRLVAITGPCHAEEVALEKQSYLTIASHSTAEAERFAALMTCRFVKASSMDDLTGVEYCAVLKNIIAIACGIARGTNYGDNFQAVLVANAMEEIDRFLEAIHPLDRDMHASPYLGDLLVTCYSQYSRNRTFGNMIGRGYSVKAAQLEMNMVAEGYYAVKSIYEINKVLGVNMPITNMVYHVLYERIAPMVEMKIIQALLR
jgi:glycerol-3-phosphate dehydrogenase (NAD(P)+)